MLKKFMWLNVLLSLFLAFGCSSGDKRAADPSEVPGAFTITANGGDSTPTDAGYGNAGSAGSLYVYSSEYGSNSRSNTTIAVKNTDAVEATVTFPATVPIDLGPTPLNVTADLTIAVVDTKPEAGTFYMVDGPDNIFLSDGVADTLGTDDEIVTGVSIAAGATLTLALNDGGGEARIELDYDFHNAGTVTVENEADSLNSGDLDIECGVFYGEAGSSIVLTGDTSDDAAGGNGGNCDIDSQMLSIFNQGSVDTSGGSGLTGGSAGEIDFRADLQLINTGSLTAIGGAGTDVAGGSGGSGGDVDIYAYYGKTANSGAITTTGGNGTTSGGSAGDIDVYLDYMGDVVNTGNLIANGGSGETGSGGYGGSLDIYAYGGAVQNSADLTAVGGASTNSLAGYGGDIWIFVDYGEGMSVQEFIPAQGVEVSGNMDVSGAAGTYGGQGGDIYIGDDSGSNDASVLLKGYTNLTANGGNSNIDETSGYGGYGGGGGYIGIGTGMYLDETATDETAVLALAGISVSNSATVSANGGNGKYDAGDGGHFSLAGGEGRLVGAPGFPGDDGDDDAINMVNREVINTGDLTLSGGNCISDDGSTYGGYGGGVMLSLAGSYGSQLSNSGAVTLNGGSASGTNAEVYRQGGPGGQLYMYATATYDEDATDLDLDLAPMTVTNSGNATLNGGASTLYGGQAGYVYIFGYNTTVENTGMVEALGGAGTGETEMYEGYGGSGGFLMLAAMLNPESNDSGYGGYGGYLADSDASLTVIKPFDLTMVNTGDADLMGGAGVTSGGSLGGAVVYGYDSVNNQGNITVNGGAASGDNAYGGDNMDMRLSGPGDSSMTLMINSDQGSATNSGALTALGGDAPGEDSFAGDGGFAVVTGQTAVNYGNLICTGGNASLATEESGDVPATVGGTGGDGGNAGVISLNGTSTNVAATINVSGGTGETPGQSGRIILDGVAAL